MNLYNYYPLQRYLMTFIDTIMEFRDSEKTRFGTVPAFLERYSQIYASFAQHNADDTWRLLQALIRC